MSVFGEIMRGVMATRCRRIDRAVANAVEEQYATLDALLRRSRHTMFGRRWGLATVRGAEQFASRVPRFDYGSYEEYIDLMRRGERNVCAPGRVGMFAVSSGSTSSRSKYIPVTQDSMRRNHLRGMADVVAMYLRANPLSRIFDGRTLTMGGSVRVEQGALVGDLSALTIKAAGHWADALRAPSMSVALMSDFDAKCRAICEECARERVIAMAGVPSWTMAMLRRVLEYTGKSTISQVWHDMELFIHGGVSFKPYRESFRQVLGREINYMESYNASEGFVAIADRCGSDEMLLMPHYGCYYEFACGGDVVPLEGVQRGVDYALLLSSENGLWRYELGDVVRFSEVDPYRLRIVGRTRQYINAFGEELMLGNAEEALMRGSMVTGAVVEEFTISPVFEHATGGGYHRWVLEFACTPESVEAFVREVDNALRELNSDYDAKRRSVMRCLEVEVVSRGTFHRWQSLRDRRKVPRLMSDGAISDDILSCDNERSRNREKKH